MALHRASMALLAAFVVIGGCSDSGKDIDETDIETDTDSDSDTDTDSDSDTETETDPDDWPYPEPTDNLTENPACEDFNGTPVNGGTRYLVGDYSFDGADASGFFYYILFANDHWESNGGADCQVVWELSGTKGPPSENCPSCDYRIEGTLVVNLAASDCPSAFYSGSETFDDVVDVSVGSDNTTRYFTSSGTEIGSGYATETRSTYTSNGGCVVF